MSSGGRRFIRHCALAGGSVVATSALFLAAPAGATMKKLSLATAFTGLALLGWTLILGPLRERIGQPNPVSTNLRRDIGIWAAIAGTIHTIVGLRVHMKGDILRYFTPPPGAGVSKSLLAFLTANYTGLVASLLLLVLLAISNDISLRRLGVPKWKRIQRFNYWLFALVAIHGILYLAVDKSQWKISAPFVAIVAAVTGAQIAGRSARLARVADVRGGTSDGAPLP